ERNDHARQCAVPCGRMILKKQAYGKHEVASKNQPGGERPATHPPFGEIELRAFPLIAQIEQHRFTRRSARRCEQFSFRRFAKEIATHKIPPHATEGDEPPQRGLLETL